MNHYFFCQLRPVGRSGRPWEAEIALPMKCLTRGKGRRLHQTLHLRRFMSHRKWRMSPKSVFCVFCALGKGRGAPTPVFYEGLGFGKGNGPRSLYFTRCLGLRHGRRDPTACILRSFLASGKGAWASNLILRSFFPFGAAGKTKNPVTHPRLAGLFWISGRVLFDPFSGFC